MFQVTPGAEAPAEMNFYFPDHKALCTAENTSHTLHNIVTLRGAQVRDARRWAAYLTETIDLWGDDLEVVFASHHWPTWGQERAVGFLSMQRDMYAYLHDQTLRLMNLGYVGAEIAEMLEMPPALAEQWHTHGYYGSVSHNVKVLNHVLFSDEHHQAARALQADAFEQIAFGAENGTWRNVFLVGASSPASRSASTVRRRGTSTSCCRSSSPTSTRPTCSNFATESPTTGARTHQPTAAPR